jgi:hypothetical protein
MTVRETDAGTPVVDFTDQEYAKWLQHEVWRLTGMPVDAFVRAYEAGELDESDPVVSELVGLLRIGQTDSDTG